MHAIPSGDTCDEAPQYVKAIPEIGIDARFLTTGLGTYMFNVVKNLNRCGEIRIRALTRAGNIDILRPYCDSFQIVGAGMYTATEQVAVLKAAASCDLLHIPHYNVPLGYRGALLVTIHDLTHALDRSLKRTWKSLIYARPMLHFAAKRAAHIITVSHYSKRNIVALLGVPEEKVSVIWNGVSEEFYPEPQNSSRSTVQTLLGFEGPYLLFLGNLKPHKNVEGLLRAFAILNERRSLEHKLLIVGEDRVGGPALMKAAARLKLGHKVMFVPRIEQRYVRPLYCGAALTILPSFEEGFGLTVLESMACGTPVACSNTASIPEVGGDAVRYFDPTSPESIAATICEVMSSSALQRELVSRGIDRARLFDWKASAKSHLELYQQLAS
jgi:glycosyltransferase involved in cell wall biosynthesis